MMTPGFCKAQKIHALSVKFPWTRNSRKRYPTKRTRFCANRAVFCLDKRATVHNNHCRLPHDHSLPSIFLPRPNHSCLICRLKEDQAGEDGNESGAGTAAEQLHPDDPAPAAATAATSTSAVPAAADKPELQADDGGPEEPKEPTREEHIAKMQKDKELRRARDQAASLHERSVSDAAIKQVLCTSRITTHVSMYIQIGYGSEFSAISLCQTALDCEAQRTGHRHVLFRGSSRPFSRQWICGDTYYKTNIANKAYEFKDGEL
eukprot:6198384-Pleurochrysis_carterae.AAC.2